MEKGGLFSWELSKKCGWQGVVSARILFMKSWLVGVLPHSFNFIAALSLALI
jgi:hypothetical protein